MLNRHSIVVVLSALLLSAVSAEPLTIAVASNFKGTAGDVANLFTQQTGQAVRMSSASTGKLYAQISNGAPFDLLLAADSEHPRLLESSGHGVSGTRFTYAIGSLVLWSRDENQEQGQCRQQLNDLGRARLAIANPETAPYGTAAKQFLQNARLWESVEPRLVYGENIAQTLHFVVSGNASLGLIAKSQAIDARLPAATCTWPVPRQQHTALEQQAILLRRASGNDAALAFLTFLRSDSARDLILQRGYAVSE